MLRRLLYTPVLTYQQALILRFHPYCFFNPALMTPKQEVLNQTFIKEPEYYCDSGGYQLYSINDNYNKGKGKKRCIVFPGVGKRVSNNYLILDPEYLCRMFGELNVKYGFTMDYPMLGSTKKEFKTNLSESFGLAKLMFKKRDELCPQTKFLIPLHFETKRQLERYFDKMSSLNPKGFNNSPTTIFSIVLNRVVAGAQ